MTLQRSHTPSREALDRVELRCCYATPQLAGQPVSNRKPRIWSPKYSWPVDGD
jgi:hypothetical protein